jgi:hypothetical protein
LIKFTSLQSRRAGRDPAAANRFAILYGWRSDSHAKKRNTPRLGCRLRGFRAMFSQDVERGAWFACHGISKGQARQNLGADPRIVNPIFSLPPLRKVRSSSRIQMACRA